MSGTPVSGSLFAVEGGPTGTVEFSAAEDARVLRGFLDSRAGQPLPITLAIPADADTDVEGHAESPSVALTLILDDDTAGHAINVQFPTAADAAKFRRNLIISGALAGSIVLGSAGAMLISSQAGSPVDTGTMSRTPVYERPAGRGLLEGVDPAESISTVSTVSEAAAASATGASSLVDPITGRPADRGFLEGEDGSPGAAPSVSRPDVVRPAGSGPLEGADE